MKIIPKLLNISNINVISDDIKLNTVKISFVFFLSALPKCELHEFCGFIRPDFGFLYQRCTCSEIQNCQYNLDGEETIDDIDSELLFPRGRMIRSKCELKESFEDW